LEEEVDMPICNLMEIIHNIWPQQSRGKNAYLYATTLNDYVKTFKQSMLYNVFLHGGEFEIALN
jgi:hypothetical protein